MSETERMEATEVFENDIFMYLTLFCEENHIEDMKKESQSVWNSCLRYIYKHVFKVRKELLRASNNITIRNNTIPSNFNAYDYSKVMDILNIYIYDMCFRFDKEVSILGFSTLTGINDSIIYDWGNNSTSLSTLSCDIYEKLRTYREESLANKLATGKQNPVGVLAILNRHYQWNLPGVTKETKQQPLTSAELPKLCVSTENQIEMHDAD